MIFYGFRKLNTHVHLSKKKGKKLKINNIFVLFIFQANYAHGDIKPGNIMWSGQVLLKLFLKRFVKLGAKN